jgi:dextranase
VYVEVWEPHTTLAELAAVAVRARASADGKPVVVAAYQHVYAHAEPAASDLATSFTMATLFSHGATQLLVGEGDRVLVDPYYPRNHAMAASTAELLHRWYDFLVEHGELLPPADAVDVTGSYVGRHNDDLEVGYPATIVCGAPVQGRVWRRVVQVGDALVVHLVNLAGQDDTAWDAPRRTPEPIGDGVLRVRRTGPGVPRVQVADPDRSPVLTPVPVRVDGDHAVAQLPEPFVWQMVVIDEPTKSIAPATTMP